MNWRRRHLSTVVLALFAIGNAVPQGIAHASGPAAGTPCTDTLKIVAADEAEMLCSIISTGPPVMQWEPFNKELETVVRGSSCGPAGQWGDFRLARSSDDYLVWCVGSDYRPTWVLATP